MAPKWFGVSRFSLGSHQATPPGRSRTDATLKDELLRRSYRGKNKSSAARNLYLTTPARPL